MAKTEVESRGAAVRRSDENPIHCGRCGCFAGFEFERMEYANGDVQVACGKVNRQPPPDSCDCICHSSWRWVNRRPAMAS